MREVRVFPDLDAVAENVGNALIEKLDDLSHGGKEVHVMLTGGTVGIKSLVRAAESIGFAQLQNRKIHFWWGDERFVPEAHPDRNAVQARDAFLEKLNPPENYVHEFPASDQGQTLDEAAANFSEVFRASGAKFDLVLLGVGPDGHIASLFPGSAMPKDENFVFAEHSSPKPPTQRLSFSYETLNQSDEVWFLAAGAEKQSVVNEVLSQGSQSVLPAAKVSGKTKTVWFIDLAASPAA